MNSFNHYSFGAVGEYLFGTVGGIGEAAPGYRHIRIAPVPGPGLDWVKASYDSINGKIATAWKLEAGKFGLEVTIPANTTATVHVPAKGQAAVTESGKPAAEAEGVKFLRMENGAAIFTVGSGHYRFQAER
jgi:alpha-L-rhamnosidase